MRFLGKFWNNKKNSLIELKTNKKIFFASQVLRNRI